MASSLPLVLLPGMGADRRLFQGQCAHFENLITPDWIDPLPAESLPSYARRMARTVDLRGPCFVGGASFGGMVALEMGPHLDARACFLIGSIRGPNELPRRIRLLRPAARLIPNCCAGLPGRLARLALFAAGPLMRPATRSLLGQLADADGRFVRWASLAVLRWERPPGPPAIPILQIHGDRDHVLPYRLTKPDVLVRGAGHLLPMTFPEVLNGFLDEQMKRALESETLPPPRA